MGGGQQRWCIVKGQAAPVGALVTELIPGDAHRREGCRQAWDVADCVQEGAHEGWQAQQQAGQEGGTGGGQDGRLMICCFFTCNAVQERERERDATSYGFHSWGIATMVAFIDEQPHA